jgi:hypothetical protein
MNKYTILLLLFVINIYQSKACDACGCAVSTAIQPSDKLTYIGLSYRSAYFKGWHQEVVGNPIFIKEYFQRTDLMAKLTLRQRWELIAALPYIQTFVKRNIATAHYQGVGDVNLMLRYALLNYFGEKFDVRLSIGGGVELPTGKYNLAETDGSVSHVYQLGSGAFNYIGMISGGLRNSKYGTFFNIAYRHNGINALGYHRGNATMVNIDFFKDMYVGKIHCLPKLSVFGEVNQRNRLDGFPYINNTARNFVFGGVGVDVFYKKFYFNNAIQLPVYQNLTHGQLANKGRFQAAINYIF